jgi:hypothetical protein
VGRQKAVGGDNEKASDAAIEQLYTDARISDEHIGIGYCRGQLQFTGWIAPLLCKHGTFSAASNG